MKDIYEIKYADPNSSDFFKTKDENDFKRQLVKQSKKWSYALIVFAIIFFGLPDIYLNWHQETSHLFRTFAFLFILVGQTVVWIFHYFKIKKEKLN